MTNAIASGPNRHDSAPAPKRAAPGAAKPVLDGRRPVARSVMSSRSFPMVALVVAVPLAWGWGLSWLDVGLVVGFYFLSGLGVTVGFTATSPTAGSRRTGGCAMGSRSPAVWPCRAT